LPRAQADTAGGTAVADEEIAIEQHMTQG